MEIEIIEAEELDDIVRIDSVLRQLITSMEGTIPGSRSFGLAGAAADFMPEDARNELLMELDEKVEEYLPEIAIEEAEIVEAEGGGLLLRVSIVPGEEDEE